MQLQLRAPDGGLVDDHAVVVLVVDVLAIAVIAATAVVIVWTMCVSLLLLLWLSRSLVLLRGCCIRLWLAGSCGGV